MYHMRRYRSRPEIVRGGLQLKSQAHTSDNPLTNLEHSFYNPL